MVSISEIAKRTNVSKTLVSRVINNKPGVSPENRERILATIKELNYHPNTLARSLVTQHTHTIGIVMNNLCDPFNFDLIDSIQEEAEKLGYNAIFCSGHDSDQIKLKYVEFFSQGITDGVIAYGSYIKNDKIINDIAASNSKFVLIEGTLPNHSINNILVDNLKGAYMATEHLIKAGYKKIRCFTADMNYKCSLDRLNGFVQAMHDYAVPINPKDIINADFTAKTGYLRMQEMIESGDLPDAIFFGADLSAFGAIRAMDKYGLKTPDDIAIIGFDDDKPTDFDFIYPKLTTIRHPLRDMGIASVDLIVKSIKNPKLSTEIKVFTPELIIRDTCK